MNDKQYRDLAAMSAAGHLASDWKGLKDAAAARTIAHWSFDLAQALVEERGRRTGLAERKPTPRGTATPQEQAAVAPSSMLSPERARLLSDALGRYPEIGMLPLDECEGRVEWACEGLRKDVALLRTAEECSEEKRIYLHLVAAALRGAELWDAEEKRLRREKST